MVVLNQLFEVVLLQALLLPLCFFALIASLFGKSVEVGIYPRLTLVNDASVLLVAKLFV